MKKYFTYIVVFEFFMKLYKDNVEECVEEEGRKKVMSKEKKFFSGFFTLKVRKTTGRGG